MTTPASLARQGAALAARPASGAPLGRQTEMAGRPGAAFTRYVRHATDAPELIAIMYAQARGEPVVRHTDYQRRLHEARLRGEPDPPRPADAELVYPSIAEQQAAVRYLTEWGWQKPAERLEVGPPEAELDLSQLSDEELAAFEALAVKASRAG